DLRRRARDLGGCREPPVPVVSAGRPARASARRHWPRSRQRRGHALAEGFVTWVRIDDSMPDNPVMAGLSDAAFRAWVESLCYCSRNLTDGYVPGRIAAQRWSPKAVDELVTAGRWEALEHG